MPRSSNTQGPVLEYITKHPNEMLYLGTISSDLNLTNDQVQKAMSRIIGTNKAGAKDHIEVCTAGHIWIWHSNPNKKSSSEMLFEQIGKSRSGTIIVESEDGTIYKLQEI